jgi:divalent metal cation (Fe/Co/Zn/Cd) transporter
MMSVHDALQAWQDGEIALDLALEVTGSANLAELHRLARECDAEMRIRSGEGDDAGRIIDDFASALGKRP